MAREHEIDPDYIPGTQYDVGDIPTEEECLALRDGKVLIPQPTISPNDPLRWSKARKYWHLALILFMTGLTAATSNSVSAAEDGITDEYGISEETFGVGDGILFIGIGWWTWFSAPSVSLWGCKINYLMSAVLSIVGNIWFGRSKRGSDVVWSQLFIGASESVTEAVTQLSITQIFYQPEANDFIGLYVLSLSVGTFVGPLITSILADGTTWHWVGYLPVIVSAVALIVLMFGLEETYFDRMHWEPLTGQVIEGQIVSDGAGIVSKKDSASLSGIETKVSPMDNVMFATEQRETESPPPDVEKNGVRPQITAQTLRPDVVNEVKQSVPDKPKTYWQKMKFITPASNLRGWGFKQYLKRLLLMTRVFIFPPVLFSGLQWGAQDAWLNFYIDLEDDYYYSPPFNYSNNGVGIMNLPTLIGAVIGCVYGAWFSDWFMKVLEKRNGGVREAEMRLWCLIPAGIISPVGMILLGVGTERGWAWYPTYVGLGMIGFGWGCCGDLSMSYLVDCYPEMVLEGMVGVSMINNNIGMIFGFVADNWLSAIGPQNTMISNAVLNFFFVALTLPMIYWGKSCRKWTRKYYFSFVEYRDGLDS